MRARERRGPALRRRAVWAAISATAVATAITAVSATATPTLARANGVDTAHGQPMAPGRHAVAGMRNATSSLNWSGYVVKRARRPIVAVNADFVVPKVASVLPPGFASTWVGIGGFNTNDLIQAGVEEDTLGSPLTGPQYSAWFELLPDASTPLSGCRGPVAGCAVAPGDHIRIGIRKTGVDRWRIAMTDAGHWWWTKTVHYRSSESSAEWITEAPQLLVAQTVITHLDSVRFDGHNTYGVARRARAFTIGQGRPALIVLGFGGPATEAVPSALDRDGDGFSVCTYASVCPAPAS